MAKAKTPSFVVEQKIETLPSDEFFLEKKFFACHKIYNTAAKHYRQEVEKLYQDERYMKAMELLKQAEGSEKSKYAEKIFHLMTEYELTEYHIQKYMGNQRNNSFQKAVNSAVVQKIATSLYVSIKKAVYRNTKIHFRKKGQTTSFEGKSNQTGIVYQNGTVKIMGRTMKLKPVRYNDYYLQEALTHKVKYCRVVRKPFWNGYKYFLQLVLEGTPPKKHKLGRGLCGVDQGTSTLAFYNEQESDFVVLADGVKPYNKEIKKWATTFERRRRLNNPECYNTDGTIKKGAKFKYTKGCQKALMRLKNAYRVKSVYVKQQHNILANRILKSCDTLIKEPMNFKALQRRSKKTEKQDKVSTITKKDGTSIQVQKYKKKKRFGKSLQNRSPGLFNQILENKFKQYEGTIIEVESKTYKASQYNHTTELPTKSKLSERTKYIDKHLVQRDLYSAFLLCCMKDTKHIDFEMCKELFEDFLTKQEEVVNRMKQIGDSTKNFGIRSFA